MAKAFFDRLKFHVILSCAVIASFIAGAAQAQSDITTTVLPAITTVLRDFGSNVILPIVGTALAGLLAVALSKVSQYFGTQTAEALRHTINMAIQNGLMANAEQNPNKTADQLVAEAVQHVKTALPGAIATLGAKDGPLMTIASAQLSHLVNAGLTTYLGAPAKPVEPKP